MAIEIVTHQDGSSVMLGTGSELLDRYVTLPPMVAWGITVRHDAHAALVCESPDHDDQGDLPRQSRLIVPDSDTFAIVEEDAVQTVFCEKCGLQYRDRLLARGGERQE